MNAHLIALCPVYALTCLFAMRSLIENMPFFPEHTVSVASAENNSTPCLWDSIFFKCLLHSCENVPSSGQPGRGK